MFLVPAHRWQRLVTTLDLRWFTARQAQSEQPFQPHVLIVQKDQGQMQLQQTTASDIVQPFKFKTVQELYDAPIENINFSVENLLPSGGFSVLIGKPKAGKTTLVRQLAVAVEEGDRTGWGSLHRFGGKRIRGENSLQRFGASRF